MLAFAATALLPTTARASFSLPSGSSSPGHGISNILSGSVVNGGLYWSTAPTWVNSTPAKPYTVETGFILPPCDAIPVARLVMTVWGGTANYVSEMTVAVNGTNLPAAQPLVFGTTGDTNAIFDAAAANVYGSGSGVWLLSLPVPGDRLRKNGASNSVVVTQTTPDSFDGRIHHVTLVAVYQAAALTNVLDYAVAEGSGDIFKTPAGAQADQRTVALAAVDPSNASAATLMALYTYGDSLSDGLFFNGVQCGGDNVAQWDAGTVYYGPSVVRFDVLAQLAATNTVRFSLASADLVGIPETSLRPQLTALAVTHPAPVPPTLSIAVQMNQAELVISGEANRSYTILSSTNLADWDESGSLTSTNGVSRWPVPATNSCRFFRVRAP